QHSAASRCAVSAHSVVVCTLALNLLDLHARVAELEAALAERLTDNLPSRYLPREVPGLGLQWIATIRAELGDIGRFRRVDEVIAYLGLEPRTHESGR